MGTAAPSLAVFWMVPEGGNRNPLPDLRCPFLAAQKGARRRHDQESGVKKGNMEGRQPGTRRADVGRR